MTVAGWIQKQRYLIEMTLSSLLRRKGKFTALIVVYTSIVFLLASVMFFTEALEREARVVLSGAPDIVVQKLVAGRHDLIPSDYADAIREIRGVTSVRPALWGYYFDPVFGANYTVMVPEPFEHDRGEVAIGPGVAKATGSEIDYILPIWTSKGKLTSFFVKELVSSESQLVSADLILMSEPDFRMVFDIPEHLATNLVIEVRNPRELPVIAAKITDLLPDTRPVLKSEVQRTYDSVFSWRSGVVVAVLIGSVLAFIIFAWDRASGLSAEERREIGILKAIGWETSDVIQMKFWEGTVVSLTSFLLGVLGAYAHVFLTSSTLFEPVLKGWAVIYPEFRLVPFVDAYQIAVLFFLTVVPYTVSTIVPSWRAATIDPDAVMRA
jgi:ABC-type lipoprotein release transport system permease subunit